MTKTLAPYHVHVWYRLTEALSPDELAACCSLLSAEERLRCERFVFERDRRDFAAAHALLRHTLSLYGDRGPADWQFVALAHGKPVLAPPSTLSFNLSHTHGLVACAVAADGEIGIDVETVDPTRAHRDVAARFFSAAENQALNALPPEHYAARFTELWTLKESYIKALGLGLSHPLNAFSFLLEGEQDIHFEAPPDAALGDWHFALAAPTPAFRLAVAVRWPARVPWRISLHDASGGETLSTAVQRQSFIHERSAT